MLVLSRGPQDRVVFPNLGVSVEILRISGNRVRLGVDAPPDVRVLRHELVENSSASSAPNSPDVSAVDAVGSGIEVDAQALLASSAAQAELIQRTQYDHLLRNRLNTAQIALGLAEKQLNSGMADHALATLHQAIHAFATLDAEIATANQKTEPTPEPRRALLVEDDANECELLAGYLRLSGFEVDTAEDGLKAMVYLSRHRRPDVVLMDMHMPHFDGPKAVQGIRKNPAYQDMRVFAVTGAQPADVSIEIGPSGVDRWFHKPINPQHLVDEINRDLRI
jgi:two-component system, OmpR family, response regulator